MQQIYVNALEINQTDGNAVSIADWKIKRLHGKRVLFHCCPDYNYTASATLNTLGSWYCSYCLAKAPPEIDDAADLCKCDPERQFLCNLGWADE